MVEDPRALGNDSACHTKPDRPIGMESGMWCNLKSPGFHRGLCVERGENVSWNAKIGDRPSRHAG